MLALALLCRTTGYGAIFAGGRVNLLGADSHYHTLRLRSQARVWPRLDSQRDHQIAHPQGYDVNWPPGFDYLAATLLRLAHVGAADVDGAARLGTSLVVALGCLTALVAALLARQLGLSLLWVLVAGLAAAALPIAVEYSRVGRVDHHVAETLFTLLLPLLHLRAAASRHPLRGQLGVGLLMGASFWLWPSALLGVGLWIAVLLLGAWWAQRLEQARAAAIQSAVAALLLAPLAVHMPPTVRWSLACPSWAQLWLLVLAFLAASTLYLTVARWPVSDWRSLRRGRWRSLLVPLLLAATLPFSPFAAGFAQLWSFGAKEQLWGLLLEQRSLFALPAAQQLLLGTYLVYALIPLALLAVWRRSWQPGVKLMAAFGLPLLSLGLFQLRFLPTGALLVLPLAALGLDEVGQWLQLQKGAGRWVTAALAGAWLLALQPALPFALTERSLPEPGRLAREELARWLGRHTRTAERPSTGAQSLAREGVFTPINMGQLTANLANLPVVGSTVIVEGTVSANRDTMAFYSASDLGKAAELARRRRIRWVLVTRFPRRRYQRFRRLLGWPVLAGAKLAQAHRRSLAVRLLIDFGARAPAGPAQPPLSPLAWLQHRHESALQGPIPAAQLYRRVAGARLVGRARPGASVQLYLPLLTNRGRPFVYRVDITAAADGRFELRLPYATTPATRELTGTRGPLRLRADGREVQLKVDQSAVERGSIVTVPALTPAAIPDGSPPSTAPTKAAPSAPSAL